MSTNTVSLTALAHELILLTGEQPPPYRRLWNLVVDGQLPAVQVAGRYRIERSDLPAIAATLGLVRSKPARVAA